MSTLQAKAIVVHLRNLCRSAHTGIVATTERSSSAAHADCAKATLCEEESKELPTSDQATHAVTSSPKFDAMVCPDLIRLEVGRRCQVGGSRLRVR
jgi:hypothetical protein